ncbi:MAG TPA: XRE family transcriptional regulator [Thermomicrobiaceae bacterium]|nr:XRE family transcriptional regulator [Thermomicrobiaceae bacterium]
MRQEIAERGPNGHGPAVEELDLGGRIRATRQERGFSLAELASRAEVSKSLISQIERGIVAPSVETVRKIASALEVPVFSLFLSSLEGDLVVRADARRAVGYPGSPIKREILSPNLKGRMVLLWVTLPPHAESGPIPVHHTGEESVVVIHGALEVLVGERSTRLEQGDAMTFDSELPHIFRNPGGEPCEAVVAISPPHL